ncbi:hypothetical protein [Paramuribaculum intestinale]|uniref:hypothetical protein n=1 Tax=Paramuribaculum intestinale TaxID=2094151 RepID=UPI0032B29AFD
MIFRSHSAILFDVAVVSICLNLLKAGHTIGLRKFKPCPQALSILEQSDITDGLHGSRGIQHIGPELLQQYVPGGNNIILT